MAAAEGRADPRPAGHPPVAIGKVGVLLINLGSPDAPTKSAVRRYLLDFLSDKRVVEIPAFIWQPILRGLVLTVRPRKTAANYARIWQEDSPLRLNTRRQAEALADAWPGVTVDFAMRYGNPSIPSRLEAMHAAGCDRILLAPLYPQYSSATTGTAIEHGWNSLDHMRWIPATRTLPSYHDHPAHIAALAASVREGVAALDFEPEAVLASFHGMPKRTLELGDPYHCHCSKTARLLREALGWPEGRLRLCFQSRFGRAEWLQPYTEPTLEALAKEGIRKVAVVCPSFSVDCLETLEEIAIGAKEIFEHAGGTHFAYLPCLNDSAQGIEMLRCIIGESLAGWVPQG
ncbi:ferrochelatase [Sandaracinobacteroides saxicola]|uniref:Ferrochelatase n=1 Tax=Sandaracinobacteroides saxicola TaxID=2759707 RepID=A0A7G5IMW1_9SPHN|nr:ferrochelatase [Sandaracinobacteroides saxicola]